jgi:hypothetical protein
MSRNLVYFIDLRYTFFKDRWQRAYGELRQDTMSICRRKDSAMAEHSENSSQEKQTTGWTYDEVQRDRWVFSGLTLASFLVLQIVLPTGLVDIPTKVSVFSLAVALPMNVLLVLLTSAKERLSEKVRSYVAWTAAAGTLIGVNAAFWHASWVVGVVYSVSSVITFLVAIYYLYIKGRKHSSPKGETRSGANFPEMSSNPPVN